MPDDEQKPDHSKPEAGEAHASEAPATSTPPQAADAYNPQAIAARIDRLGGESDLERVADAEEQKLLERKKAQKRGLESAASKRLARIGEDKVKRPSAAVAAGASPEADPLLRRAAKASSWVQEHRQTFGAIVVVGLLAGAGFAGYTYWQDKREGQASALLGQALTDEHGHIGEKADDDDDDTKARPMYPTFKTAAERRDAALAKYRDVESRYPGTGAAILSRLAEASLLLDAGDAKGSIGAYSDVIASPLGKADAEVRGRAYEGTGFANELLAQTDAPAAAKHQDDALAAYTKLAEIDANGFKELGMYHQARVLQAKGDKVKAIELLKDVQKRVSEPGDAHPFSYLKFVVEDRLRELDPTALPPKARADANPGGRPGGPPGAPGAAGAPGGSHIDMNDPQIQKILEQLKQKGAGGGAPAPGGPAK